MHPRRPLAVLAALVPLSALATAQEWGRFRGPNGSGAVEGAGLPTTFDAETNVQWRAELPFGSSSPVLTEDAVFLTAATPEELLVICLDRATGEERWMRPFERVHEPEVYSANDDASPSPVTDGANVYAFFQDRGLVSCDPEGEVRWELPLGPFVSFYGMAASPILAGDTLVLQCDQQQGSYVLAVDATTGKERWKTERAGINESWATPLFFPSDGKPEEVILFGSYFVCGYSLETGAELWRTKGVGFTPTASPILDGDRLFVCTPNQGEQPLPSFDAMAADRDGDGDGKLAKAELSGTPFGEHFGWVDADKDGFITAEEWDFVKAGMSGDYGLVALDLVPGGEEEAHEAWRFKRSLPSISTPLLYDGVLYLVRSGGIVTAIDPATGDALKSGRLGHGGSEQYPSPVAADGKVYVASNSGEVTVLKAGPQWEVLSVNDLGEEIHATPAIAGGTLYVRTHDALYAFREAPGR